ncbi:MAG TPA: MBOAT family O-acyltransferase [Tepidisphaeraceae bacterium]|nr:MBOAT family O-acyltransferase [Tepidisphaeraceae bacterium]
MVFSSNVFLFVFLPLVLLLYYSSPRALRFVVLTMVSYVFYAWSDPRFVLLLLWTTLFDFVCGNFIGGHWRITRGPPPQWVRGGVLAVSLGNSIGLLLFFKYAMFAQEMLNTWLDAFGAAAVPVLAVVLPAGISFYTFESISYVVDIYRGEARPAGERFLANLPPGSGGRTLFSRLTAEVRSFVAFACYLAQYPHLVAGPIIRYQELEPQLHHPLLTVERFGRGVFFLSLGLAKKVLLANTVGRAVELVFASGTLGWADAWWGVVAFAFQIYFDFSGYSDMAIGLALMLGFDFPRNFDAPYKAQSVTDFWRRWHITLSRWLRDYLYIPLGGNRKGPGRTYVNLMLTMLLGGLWHGASWNFAAWGLYHGAWLAVERAGGRRGVLPTGAPRWARVALTFAIVCVGWVLFRANDLTHALYLLMRLFLPLGDAMNTAPAALALYDAQIVVAMVVSAAVAFGGVQTWDLARRLTVAKAALAIVLFAASVIVLSVSASNPFLYFRF